MSRAPRELRPKTAFGCAYVFFPIVLLVFGVIAVSAGRQLAPQTHSDAVAFRSDPSCAADATLAQAQGACQVVAAQIVVAEMKIGGSGKTRVRSPMAYLRFADGSFHSAELNGGAGEVFVYSMTPGTQARVQLFHGDIARITAGNDAAETVSAPDVNAETVGEMPWVGSAAVGVALLIFGARVYVLRRGA